MDEKKTNQKEIECASRYAITQTIKKYAKFSKLVPQPASKNYIYEILENDLGWTGGFWSGMLWLAYDLTQDETIKEMAMRVNEIFVHESEKITLNCGHDLGFLFTLSCATGYKLTDKELYKQCAVKAADCLVGRYHEKAGLIQAWGNVSEIPYNKIIMDTMMNLSLLRFASIVTGDGSYEAIASTHYNNAIQLLTRDDGSTHHTYYFDFVTGEYLYPEQHQGYSNESCWARGQAWGIYGSALEYAQSRSDISMFYFKKLTQYFIDHLPEDYVPYWDFYFDSDQPKDSSATCIVICGILEMIQYLEGDEKKEYEEIADRMLLSLIHNYTTKDIVSNGLITYGSYHVPKNNGVNECVLWGDYFYIEALARKLGKGNKVW